MARPDLETTSANDFIGPVKADTEYLSTDFPEAEYQSPETLRSELRIPGANPLYSLQKPSAEKEIRTGEEPLHIFPFGLKADIIRKMNRLITARLPKHVREALIDERNQLVTKKFEVGLSTKEERRLTYVRWQLDRIDDAESGQYLDFLEAVAQEQENLAQQIDRLLDGLSPSRKTR